jgi:hypothetical protein
MKVYNKLKTHKKILHNKKKVYKNKTHKKKLNKKIKKIKYKGGSVCPKSGFHQYEGQCWNDAMMMILCYSTGISDKIQEFFVYIKKKTEGNTTNETKQFIHEIIDRIDTIEHKKQFFYLLPINIDNDNKEQCDTFKKASKDYITNMYLRYINEQAFNRISRPPLQRQISMDVSLGCSRANNAIQNMNRIKQTEVGAGGEPIKSNITICIINYFILNLVIVNDEIVLPINNAELSLLNVNYVRQNNDTIIETSVMLEGKSLLSDKTYNDLYNDINILKNPQNTYSAINLSVGNQYIKRDHDQFLLNGGAHAISFFSCNNINYYYNDNGITSDNQLNVLYEIDWKSKFIDYLTKICEINKTFLDENKQFQIMNKKYLITDIECENVLTCGDLVSYIKKYNLQRVGLYKVNEDINKIGVEKINNYKEKFPEFTKKINEFKTIMNFNTSFLSEIENSTLLYEPTGNNTYAYKIIGIEIIVKKPYNFESLCDNITNIYSTTLTENIRELYDKDLLLNNLIKILQYTFDLFCTPKYNNKENANIFKKVLTFRGIFNEEIKQVFPDSGETILAELKKFDIELSSP